MALTVDARFTARFLRGDAGRLYPRAVPVLARHELALATRAGGDRHGHQRTEKRQAEHHDRELDANQYVSLRS